MTGRERIEAAFSARGAARMPAVICYEGIYYRDHWEALTKRPWWYSMSPKVEQQLEWRREAMEGTGQDWFVLPVCAAREVGRR